MKEHKTDIHNPRQYVSIILQSELSKGYILIVDHILVVDHFLIVDHSLIVDHFLKVDHFLIQIRRSVHSSIYYTCKFLQITIWKSDVSTTYIFRIARIAINPGKSSNCNLKSINCDTILLVQLVSVCLNEQRGQFSLDVNIYP